MRSIAPSFIPIIGIFYILFQNQEWKDAYRETKFFSTFILVENLLSITALIYFWIKFFPVSFLIFYAISIISILVFLIKLSRST